MDKVVIGLGAGIMVILLFEYGKERKMRKPGKVELWKALDGKWYFHKKNPNGKVTSPSQGYKQKRYAKEAIERDIPGLEVVELIMKEK